MKQVWIPRPGPPEVLEVRETDAPEPKHGELRIRVRAAGVNFADVLARMGLYPDAPPLPAVVGYEVAGEVDAVGPGVPPERVGERVAALTRFGGYSELVVVPSEQAAPIPARLSFEEAAALPVNYLTAWLMLVHLGCVRAGDTVLVHGAAGGVGQAAVQIARSRGARVLGTASPHKHERLRAAGVDACFDSRGKDVVEQVRAATGGRGVEIALDPIGGRSFKRSYDCLAPLGRLFVFGVSSLAPGKRRNPLKALVGLASMPFFHPVALMNANRGVIGVNLGHLWERGPELRAMLDDVLAGVESGSLAPVVDRSFPLAQAAAAHARLQDRQNFGKVLLVP